MPIISARVQDALRQAGILEDPSLKKDDNDVNAILDSEGLSLRETIKNLSDVAQGADTSSARLRANEIAFKLRGVLKDQAPPPPAFNIIIQDSGPDHTINGINRILIPRTESVQ